MQLGISEPLVFTEVEIHPQPLQILWLSRLHAQQVLEERLVPLLDLLAQHIAIGENLQPKLRNELISEVVVLGLLLLLRQQLPDLLEVSIREGMLPRNDVVDLVGQGIESLAEASLDSLDLALKLAVELALLDEIAVECDRLDLLRKGRQSLDLGLNLRLDVDLGKINSTSSSSPSPQSSENSSGQSSTYYLAFLSLPPINNQLIYNNSISPYITHPYTLNQLTSKIMTISLPVACNVVLCLFMRQAVVVEIV